MSNIVVHILRHGMTLCGQPGNALEEGHKWVSFEDPEISTKADCPECLAGPKQPKTVEIERRFLVLTEKLPSELPDGKLISQGYLSIDPAVRVRMSGNNAWITVKGPGTVEREEFEYSIPWQDAERMLKLCRYTILKTRRKMKQGRHIWDVDEFHGSHQGLWMAEVELQERYEGYEPPIWVGREVSDDRRYTNASLARAAKIPT